MGKCQGALSPQDAHLRTLTTSLWLRTGSSSTTEMRLLRTRLTHRFLRCAGQNRGRPPGRGCRLSHTVAGEPAATRTPPPSRNQLTKLALASGIPFVGFGIADNAIMILAGDQIDLTLGEKLGWSTLAAAGFGNTLSDIVGLWLGDHIEAMAARLGVQAPALTQAQAQLPITRRTKLAANVVGLTVGCLIGMLPLLVLQDRKQVYFDADALALYETVFAPYGVSPTQFFELMHLCRWQRRRGRAAPRGGVGLSAPRVRSTGARTRRATSSSSRGRRARPALSPPLPPAPVPRLSSGALLPSTVPLCCP